MRCQSKAWQCQGKESEEPFDHKPNLWLLAHKPPECWDFWPNMQETQVAEHAAALLPKCRLWRFCCCVQGPPPGCSRYTVELRKPLGIVLEQKDKSGDIFVVSGSSKVGCSPTFCSVVSNYC